MKDAKKLYFLFYKSLIINFAKVINENSQKKSRLRTKLKRLFFTNKPSLQKLNFQRELTYCRIP